VNLFRDGFELSDERDRLDLEAIWAYLRTAYWSPGVPREVVERSIRGSLCLGLYDPGGAQAGFARAVTDGATFAWIADVFVFEAHRGRGLGVWVVESLLAHPDLQGLRAIMLATRDAHPLYERFGFERIGGRWMTLATPAETLYRPLDSPGPGS
jgi:GNAT superfamily N-acetyltransferase